MDNPKNPPALDGTERALKCARLLTGADCYFCTKKLPKDDIFMFTDPDHDRLCEEFGAAPMYGAHKACAKEHADDLRVVPGHKIPRLVRHMLKNL